MTADIHHIRFVIVWGRASSLTADLHHIRFVIVWGGVRSVTADHITLGL